ncbi:hypothetical protein GCM10009114_23970 [Aliiglaciecola litoralis]|uniref:Peptidase C14 caspase domain-containing protein n=2 Tax=Aliiglaciecola litoralis TaxID=582857 RepID=A0ABN1LLF8_9ALTE
MASEYQVERFALVIGNQAYAAAPLKHAENDARQIASALESIDFQVTTLLNLDKSSLTRDVSVFFKQVQESNSPAKLVLFFYAGHAMQINQANYLIPIGLAFETQEQLLNNLYDLSELFAHMHSNKDVQHVVILDACRNNPFGQGIKSPGLASIKAPTGTIIAYATEPGGIASDGRDGNGIYTKHLLKHIEQNMTVEALFKKVRKGVARETHNRQIPWEHSSLVGQVYLNPPPNLDLPDIVVF